MDIVASVATLRYRAASRLGDARHSSIGPSCRDVNSGRTLTPAVPEPKGPVFSRNRHRDLRAPEHVGSGRSVRQFQRRRRSVLRCRGVGGSVSDRGSEEDQWQQVGEELDGALRRAAKWMQKRSKRTAGPPLPIVDGREMAESKWSGLASAVESYAVAVSAVPGADSAISVLKALYGVEDAQALMLKSIDRQVRLLREGPFRSGQLLLREAERVGPTDEDYSGFLAKARDRFYDAHGLSTSVQERAVIELHLGLVAVLINKQADAKHWLGQSYESGTQVVEELTSKSRNVKVLHSRKVTAALTVSTYGLYVIPAKLKKVWDAELAVGALQSFVPFVNCAADSLNAVAGGSRASTLQLRTIGDGTYELRYGGPSAPA